MNPIDIRILLPSDRDAVLAFSKDRFKSKFTDAMEAELQSWTAPWRGEALDHYLPQGWCFGAFSEGRLNGYILAQPFLFYRGKTQTLWIEHLEFETEETGQALLKTVHSWSRDKHLQCMLIEKTDIAQHCLEGWPNSRELNDKWLEIRSSRSM